MRERGWRGLPVRPAIRPRIEVHSIMYEFPSQYRVRRSADYRRVMDAGYKVVCPEIVMLFRDREGEGVAHGPRLGLVVSRKVGGAVTRNRVKRRLREAFRHMRPELASDPAFARTECVVIARAAAAASDFATLSVALARGFARWKKRQGDAR